MTLSARLLVLPLLPLAVACTDAASNKDPVAEAKFQNEKRIGDEAVTKRQIRDAEFIVDAASRKMELLEISQIAQRKASAAGTRTLLQQALPQFSALQQEVQRLAQQKNMVLPTGLSASQAKEVGELTALNGAEFDRQYAKLATALLSRDADAYDDMTDDAYDGDIRALAARQLPALRQQHAAADNLGDQLTP